MSAIRAPRRKRIVQGAYFAGAHSRFDVEDLFTEYGFGSV